LIKSIVISPSGNLYGSENVLFDYLYHSKLDHLIYVPENSDFHKRLSATNFTSSHRLKTFDKNQLKQFYFSIFLKFLFGQIDVLYINEGGHIKYLKLLARIFRKKKFVVHVRMIYDCLPERIGLKLRGNIKIIAISNYVASPLEAAKINYTVLYDGFDFDKKNSIKKELTKNKLLRIGIIGRVTKTKGTMNLLPIIEELDKLNVLPMFKFYFFGETFFEGKEEGSFKRMLEKYPNNISLLGFKDSEDIYNEIDAVLHLCQEEGLGRVFFESIKNEKPFLGFDLAGIAEIGHLSKLTKLLVNPYHDNWAKSMAINIKDLIENNSQHLDAIKKSKSELFDLNTINYANKIDSILNE
jgi:hypothetical protein